MRLDGIDCPETKQDFGTRAKQATSDLCFNKEVRIEKTGVDRYGRTLGFVYVGDACVNKERPWPQTSYRHDQRYPRLPQKLVLHQLCGISPDR